jgi:hypothetical protein
MMALGVVQVGVITMERRGKRRRRQRVTRKRSWYRGVVLPEKRKRLRLTGRRGGYRGIVLPGAVEGSARFLTRGSGKLREERPPLRAARKLSRGVDQSGEEAEEAKKIIDLPLGLVSLHSPILPGGRRGQHERADPGAWRTAGGTSVAESSATAVSMGSRPGKVGEAEEAEIDRPLARAGITA